MLLHNVYAKTLRDHWKGLLGWGLGLAAIAALEVVVYPSIRERAEEMNRLVANYPEAFKAMFGLEDFTSGAGFIQAELYSLVVPLVLIALAISFGAGATAGEEEHKTVDLLLATPVTRGRVVVHKLLALVTGSVLVGLALTAMLWVGSMFQDMGIGLDRLLAATASAVLLGLCFGGVALAVGCASGRRALAAAAAAGLAIAGFLTPRQRGRHGGVAQHQLGQPRVLDHVREPLRGIGRIERTGGAAGLEDPEQRRDHVARPIEAEAHRRLGTDAQTDQVVRDLVGAPVQLFGRELAVGHHHRLRVRRRGSALLEEAVDGRVGDCGIRRVPVLQDLETFLWREDR